MLAPAPGRPTQGSISGSSPGDEVRTRSPDRCPGRSARPPDPRIGRRGRTRTERFLRALSCPAGGVAVRPPARAARPPGRAEEAGTARGARPVTDRAGPSSARLAAHRDGRQVTPAPRSAEREVGQDLGGGSQAAVRRRPASSPGSRPRRPRRRSRRCPGCPPGPGDHRVLAPPARADPSGAGRRYPSTARASTAQSVRRSPARYESGIGSAVPRRCGQGVDNPPDRHERISNLVDKPLGAAAADEYRDLCPEGPREEAHTQVLAQARRSPSAVPPGVSRVRRARSPGGRARP